MKTIYKYPIRMVDSQRLSIPLGAKLLSLQVQHGTPCLWAEVDDDEGINQELVVSVVGTGQTVPPGAVNYVGALQFGVMVFHIYTSTLR